MDEPVTGRCFRLSRPEQTSCAISTLGSITLGSIPLGHFTEIAPHVTINQFTPKTIHRNVSTADSVESGPIGFHPSPVHTSACMPALPSCRTHAAGHADGAHARSSRQAGRQQAAAGSRENDRAESTTPQPFPAEQVRGRERWLATRRTVERV